MHAFFCSFVFFVSFFYKNQMKYRTNRTWCLFVSFFRNVKDFLKSHLTKTVSLLLSVSVAQHVGWKHRVKYQDLQTKGWGSQSLLLLHIWKLRLRKGHRQHVHCARFSSWHKARR